MNSNNKKGCEGCIAFEEKEGKDGHFKPYCDMFGLFIKNLDCPCNYWDEEVKAEELDENT